MNESTKIKEEVKIYMDRVKCELVQILGHNKKISKRNVYSNKSLPQKENSQTTKLLKDVEKQQSPELEEGKE